MPAPHQLEGENRERWEEAIRLSKCPFKIKDILEAIIAFTGYDAHAQTSFGFFRIRIDVFLAIWCFEELEFGREMTEAEWYVSDSKESLFKRLLTPNLIKKHNLIPG